MSKLMAISRMRTDTDGKGLTTLVAFYGCPLRCRYCLNADCHTREIDERTEHSPEELLERVKLDDIYFRMSGGGVTFGGGEPLLQTEFLERFAQLAPKAWKIRIETSLNVSWEEVESLIPYVNQWIIDVKDMNPEIYREYTGLDNGFVIENLRRLYERVGGEQLHLRIPKIPGYNQAADIENSLNELKGYQCKKEVFDYIVSEKTER